MKKHAVCTLAPLILLALLIGCTTDDHDLLLVEKNAIDRHNDRTTGHYKPGATQISGIGYFADLTSCDYVEEGADFALELTGDLEGCVFVYVEEHDCSPSGTYRESGREHFVGSYLGESGSFWTTYKFAAKYEGCEDGFFVGAEIFGRCQHPITKDSGDGIFDGVTGRLDFKDIVETGELPYRGHLRY